VLRLYGLTGLLTLLFAVIALLTGATTWVWITLGVATAGASLIVWLRHSLPPQQGTLSLSGLREPVEVYRDQRGVPHIYARNTHDLYLAQGYITAQDRLWTMDIDRVVTAGRLAELFGARWVNLDRHFRTLGLRRAAEASLITYSNETREYLDAYAAGVNARIAEGKLPPEFALIRHRPEPWTAVDTLTLSKFTAYALSGNWEQEVLRAHLVEALGAAKAAELCWHRPDPALLHHLEEHPLPDVTNLLELAALTLNATAGGNSWAAAGSRTESGAPLLVNDPHLTLRSPGAWYQTHLVGPDGMDVTGVTFPGIPGIMAGHNRWIAWGVANLNADVQDVYLEQVDPAAPDSFRFQDHWETATHIKETIRVRGVREPIICDVLVTRHGPVIAQGEHSALSLRWTGLEATTELETYFGINRADSWPAFRDALQHYSVPPQNFIYADRKGNIASRAQGAIPIRTSGDGQAPVPGWTGEHEWTGRIPFEELPEVVNPPEGFVAHANQDLCPPGYTQFLGSSWAPPYRHERVTERLRGATSLTVDRMREIQRDAVNLQARALLQILLNAIQEGLRQTKHPESLSPIEKRAMLLLSGWDGSEEPDRPEPCLWHQWYLFIVEGIFRPQMGLTLFDQFLACGLPIPLTDRLLREVAEGEGSRWLPREGEQGLGRIALRSFRRAVALLSAKQGRSPEAWRWGREHRVMFHHPSSRGGHPLGFFLNLGSYPAPGSSSTINNQGYSQVHPFNVTVAPLWRQVVDLSRPEDSQDIAAPGQSGHFMSPHYGDQAAPWLRGDLLPQLFDHAAIRALPCLKLQPVSKG
jgi:penicillin amidase